MSRMKFIIVLVTFLAFGMYAGSSNKDAMVSAQTSPTPEPAFDQKTDLWQKKST